MLNNKLLDNVKGGDKVTFWGSLYINSGVWVLLFVWESIRLKFIWATVCLILAILAVTNTYSFIRCSKSQQKFLATQAAGMFKKQIQK